MNLTPRVYTHIVDFNVKTKAQRTESMTGLMLTADR